VSRKKFKIVISPSAGRDLKTLKHGPSIQLLKDIQSYLGTNPIPLGKPRLKKLAGFHPPLYRMRSGVFRVYYRIEEGIVVILSARHKKDSEKFLKRIQEEHYPYIKNPIKR